MLELIHGLDQLLPASLMSPLISTSLLIIQSEFKDVCFLCMVTLPRDFYPYADVFVQRLGSSVDEKGACVSKSKEDTPSLA